MWRSATSAPSFEERAELIGAVSKKGCAAVYQALLELSMPGYFSDVS